MCCNRFIGETLVHVVVFRKGCCYCSCCYEQRIEFLATNTLMSLLIWRQLVCLWM